VTAENNSPANVYIQSATLDGKTLNIPEITYEQIVSGATLKLVMGPSPSKWAADWKPEPISGRQ
jgi:putative alpha-1,2-mannosidase